MCHAITINDSMHMFHIHLHKMCCRESIFNCHWLYSMVTLMILNSQKNYWNIFTALTYIYCVKEKRCSKMPCNVCINKITVEPHINIQTSTADTCDIMKFLTVSPGLQYIRKPRSCGHILAGILVFLQPHFLSCKYCFRQILHFKFVHL